MWVVWPGSGTSGLVVRVEWVKWLVAGFNVGVDVEAYVGVDVGVVGFVFGLMLVVGLVVAVLTAVLLISVVRDVRRCMWVERDFWLVRLPSSSGPRKEVWSLALGCCSGTLRFIPIIASARLVKWGSVRIVTICLVRRHTRAL